MANVGWNRASGSSSSLSESSDSVSMSRGPDMRLGTPGAAHGLIDSNSPCLSHAADTHAVAVHTGDG